MKIFPFKIKMSIYDDNFVHSLGKVSVDLSCLTQFPRSLKSRQICHFCTTCIFWTYLSMFRFAMMLTFPFFWRPSLVLNFCRTCRFPEITAWITFSLSLFLKASLGAHSFIWKWDFIHLQIKLIFIYEWLYTKTSFEKESKGNSEMAC